MTVAMAMTLVFLAGAGKGLAVGTLTNMRLTGPRANRINIVFLAEGFTNGTEAAFISQATTQLNYLMSLPHNAAYTNYFNAFAIFVASNESGSDHPSRSIYRDTYFCSTYDTSGIARLITLVSPGSTRASQCLIEHVPEYDIPVVIVNDTEYGGSGGWLSITSINGSSPEIITHEIGHSYARLADEYESAYPGWVPYEQPNSTAKTNRADITWTTWIDGATPVPTPETAPYASVIGLFEGCQYTNASWYRPKQDCKMNHLNVPFCSVCLETHIKKNYNLLSCIDGRSPTENNLVLFGTNTLTFAVTNLAPSLQPLTTQWYRDTNAVSGATTTVHTVSAADLGLGTHSITAKVLDNTALVRNDPSQYLQDSTVWTVQVTSAGWFLDVQSPYGSTTPQLGNRAYVLGATVTNSVTSPVTQGTTQYVCTGWSLSGNSPETGSTNRFTLTLTNDASLAWNWKTQYWFDVGTSGSGTVNRSDAWVDHGSVVPIHAIPAGFYSFQEWRGSATNSITAGDVNNPTVAVDVASALWMEAAFTATLAPLGTPQSWLWSYGLTNDLAQDELDDADHDGFPTWCEYQADTVPTNDRSLLGILQIQASVTGMNLQWQGGQVARQYLEWTPALSGTNPTWTALYTNGPGTAITNATADVSAPTNTRFYRIRAERP